MGKGEKIRTIIGRPPYEGNPEDHQESQIICAVALAIRTAKDRGEREAAIVTNTLENMAANTVEGALGEQVASELLKRRAAVLHGVRLFVATPKTRDTWPPKGTVIALWPEKRLLETIEALPHVDAIFMVPWLQEDYAEWQESFDPEFVDPNDAAKAAE